MKWPDPAGRWEQIVERPGDRDGDVELRCHACDHLVAQATKSTIDVEIDLDPDGNPIDPNAYYPTWSGIEPPPVAGFLSVDTPLRLVVKLEPGFVNEKGPYDGDLPWYVKRRGRYGAFKGRVRLPAVLTCDCGADNLVPVLGSSDLSTAERKEELRADVRRPTTLSEPDEDLREQVRRRLEEVRHET